MTALVKRRLRGGASACGVVFGGIEIAEFWLRGRDLNPRPQGYELRQTRVRKGY